MKKEMKKGMSKKMMKQGKGKKSIEKMNMKAAKVVSGKNY